jgi:hypothetical protein
MDTLDRNFQRRILRKMKDKKNKKKLDQYDLEKRPKDPKHNSKRSEWRKELNNYL